MSIKKFLIIFLFIISSQTFSQTDKITKIDSFIVASMSQWKMPGFAVAIVKNDSVIFSKGYGVKDLRTGESVDENTLFMIASCSKAFTTAALARLVDQGKLKWDDPAIKYLPGFHTYDPWVTKEITIRDLVTHRSGLETFSGDILWLGSTYDAKEVIRRSQFLKPTSSFRSKYGYQNIMYSVAGSVIPVLTDTSWSDFIKYNFFKPLGMNNSVTSISEMKENGNFAQPHKFKNGEVAAYPEFYSIETVAPAGAINSSVRDMTNWIRLQLNKGQFGGRKIFSERQSTEMWANHTPIGTSNYGLGWFIRYWNGKKIYNHGGGMPGMISEVALIPEEKLGLVILSNYETGMVAAVKNYILEVINNIPAKDWNKTMLDAWNRRLDAFEKENKRREEVRVKDTKPSLPPEKFAGIFEDKMYGKAEILLKDNALHLQLLPSPTMRGELKHYHFDTFYIDWEDEFLTRGWVKFEMDFNGEIKKFSIEVPNSPDFIFTELLFEKIK
jgi:CubicO group peptidase (beta-lactamase class C family)